MKEKNNKEKGNKFNLVLIKKESKWKYESSGYRLELERDTLWEWTDHPKTIELSW